MVTTIEIPLAAADLSDHLSDFGRRAPHRKRLLYGKIDDPRFYELSEDQMLAIYNDDITGQPTVGFRNKSSMTRVLQPMIFFG